MGYFANGTEGLDYQECYCFRCKNYKIRKGEDYPGCPIWDLHLLYSYDLCNDEDSPGAIMLDTFIHRNEDTLENEQCVMFELEKVKDET